MPTTKTKPASRRTVSKSPKRPAEHSSTPAAPVLTLAEAAAYLRVSTDDVRQLVQSGNLPGRQIGQEWRFFKAALQMWLSSTPATTGRKDFWATQAGAFKDDPDLEDMQQQIYSLRGRPMTEDA